MKLPLLFLLGAICAQSSWPAEFIETFDSDPITRGWRVAGTNLYRWDAQERNLEARWDSSQPNSYFHWPLPVRLGKENSFEFALDLRLQEIAIGTSPGKSLTFQIAAGFLHLEEALRADFYRGSGVHPTYGGRSIVEVAYFPDSGFGATVAPTIMTTNNQVFYNHTHPVELQAGLLYRVNVKYDGQRRRLDAAILRDGQPIADFQGIQLPDNVTDFNLNTFAICNYNDGGQNPPQFAGSVRARGIIDNVRLVFPEPLLPRLSLLRENGVVKISAINAYGALVLERSIDLRLWDQIGGPVQSREGSALLEDASPPPERAFYRVRNEP